VLVDGGYSGKPFAEAVQKKLGATMQVAKRSEGIPPGKTILSVGF